MRPLPDRFRNRVDAGRQLSARLSQYAHRSDVTVVGLPRGGVPVAAEVAAALEAPLDICVVRKLGAPTQPELAIGAIAEGGVRILNEALVRDLGLSAGEVEAAISREGAELDHRVARFKAGRPVQSLQRRTVILVDDGLATGATMEAAVASVRRQSPERVVVAVPVGPPDTCRRLTTLADDVVCLSSPEPFSAVGEWYQVFDQTSDQEVAALLTSQPR